MEGIVSMYRCEIEVDMLYFLSSVATKKYLFFYRRKDIWHMALKGCPKLHQAVGGEVGNTESGVSVYMQDL